MKKYIRLTVLLAAAIALLVQYSCTIESIKPVYETDPLAMLENDIEEATIVEDILDEVLLDLEKYDFLKSADLCPSVTIERPESTRYPKIVTKDFGDSCVTDWGTVKSGKIIITILAPWLEEGSKRIVTFENYTHKGIAISGEKVIICKGMDENGFYKHVVRGKLTLEKPNGIVAEREIHKKRLLIAGAKDKDVPKEWLVEGYAKVVKSNGVHVTMNITEPLYRIQGCRWYQSGMKALCITIVTDDGVDDKGDGNELGDDSRCDRKVFIDYSYEEGEKKCDIFALRWVDDGEPEVINLKKR